MTDPTTGRVYFYGYNRKADRDELLDAEGNLVAVPNDLSEFDFFGILLRAGLYSTMENGCFCYRSLADGELVFEYPIVTNLD